jgi:chaperonin GroEL (HSP60 family)
MSSFLEAVALRLLCPFTSRSMLLHWYSIFIKASREQLAIAEYAQALLVIPKTLAVNAAKDSTELVAKLRAYHNASQDPQADAAKLALK